MKYEKEVTAGMELLDRVNPGWEHLIDLGNLDLKICESCILGQLYGHYWAGLNILEHVEYPDEGIRFECGFSLTLGQTGFKELTATWVAAILARREANILKIEEAELALVG